MFGFKSWLAHYTNPQLLGSGARCRSQARANGQRCDRNGIRLLKDDLNHYADQRPL